MTIGKINKNVKFFTNPELIELLLLVLILLSERLANSNDCCLIFNLAGDERLLRICNSFKLSLDPSCIESSVTFLSGPEIIDDGRILESIVEFNDVENEVKYFLIDVAPSSKSMLQSLLRIPKP